MKRFALQILVGIPVYAVGEYLTQWWTGALFIAGVIVVALWRGIDELYGETS